MKFCEYRTFSIAEYHDAERDRKFTATLISLARNVDARQLPPEK